MKEKIKRLDELMDEINECKGFMEDVEDDKKYYRKQLVNLKKLKSYKKQGNLFLIIAAIMTAVLIVLILTLKDWSSGDFWTIGTYTIGFPLLLGAILKFSGMKKYRQILEDTQGMDLDTVTKKLEDLEAESKKLNTLTDSLLEEYDEIVEYTGDNWLLNKLNPGDTEVLLQIEKDFAEAIEKGILREDEEFLRFNWISANFSAYAYARGRDASTEVFEYESGFRLLQEHPHWRLQLLGEILPIAADELLVLINHQRPRVSIKDACINLGILEREGADPEFFETTVIAIQKMVNEYTKAVFEYRENKT